VCTVAFCSQCAAPQVPAAEGPASAAGVVLGRQPPVTGDGAQIAGALILWLECLPEPLWPQQLFYPLLQAVAESDGDARRARLQLLLRQVRLIQFRSFKTA